MVYYGVWFTPLRESLDTFFAQSQKPVAGIVGLKLYKGNVSITHRCSPNSRYDTNLASFTMSGYNSRDAQGFINLFALPVVSPARDNRGKP
jgi:argininosuccinate synthase